MRSLNEFRRRKYLLQKDVHVLTPKMKLKYKGLKIRKLEEKQRSRYASQIPIDRKVNL